MMTTIMVMTTKAANVDQISDEHASKQKRLDRIGEFSLLARWPPPSRLVPEPARIG